MESEVSFPPALCIVGMHRSGTSLASSLLQKGGVDIGKRLMEPGLGNVKGTYEDLDFVHFHVQVLQSQGIHPSGFTLQRELQIREQHVHQARELVERRRRRLAAWGWKDPRTTLFLDFWQQMLPEANFLMLFRCPWDVVDSLFRRGDEVFRSNPSFAVRVWVRYNRQLLEFHDRLPERCLFVNIYRAVQTPELLREALQNKFGVNLGPMADLYDASLLHRSASSERYASLLRHLFPEALELYEQLNERASQILVNGVSPAAEPVSLLPIEDWAVQDWLALRVLEGQHRDLRKLWEKAEAELANTRNELVQARTQQACLREELERAEWQAGQERQEFEQVRRELERARRELEQSQAQLEQTQSQLRAAGERIANMESSKFWKMRRAWMTAKHSLRRAG